MPNTPRGKAISRRNATTHGLFSRDVVLPALGEDPEGYRQLEAEWTAQLDPRTLLERHYVEKIAAASWRLRRLHRWQAQIFEDPALTEDDRLGKIDKALRHETSLHRQIDTAVKMLNKDVPQLASGRARSRALSSLSRTERECRASEEADREVTLVAREALEAAPTPDVDLARLDPSEAIAGGKSPETEEEREDREKQERRAQVQRDHEKCKNELLLGTLAHPLTDKHPDGRPFYASPSAWQFVQDQITAGREARAADHDAYLRENYVANQQRALALCATYAEAPITPAIP